MGKVVFIMLMMMLPYIVIMWLVVSTGSTFDQRCSEMGYTGLDHSKCVNTLSQDKEDF